MGALTPDRLTVAGWLTGGQVSLLLSRHLLAVRLPITCGAADPSAMTAQDVRRWVTARAATASRRTARATATAIRNLVRFFMFQGWSSAHLAAAVPTLPSSRLSGPPRSLSDEQLTELLRSIDVSKPIGLRTRAIIECAASLGLRAGEIAALRICDVDWREGAICLPTTKSIFVRHYFPVGGPLQSKDITNTVRRAMVRAGLRLPSIGAHSLRHTVASRLVRAGVGIKDIADIMRHRDLDTTRVYAGVDWPRLSEVALPWPTARTP